VVYNETMEQWQATQRVEDIGIPDTLQGVLMARIDRLQEDARRVLQLASVIGRIFLYRVLAAIAEVEQELDVHLTTLQREEMIRERARVPELEYIFKHHLTREAAYSGLLRRERRLFHGQVAGALERLFPDWAEEQLGLLAHHWERSGEREQAIEYLRRAGEQAAAQYASAEAVGYFSRALELTPDEDLFERYDLLLARERVYDMQGAREDQRQDLAALQELAVALGDDGWRVEVILREARYGVVTSDYAGAIEAAERAIHLAQATGDVRREVAGHQQLGIALYDTGEYERAASVLQKALSLARAARLRREEAESLRRLGFVRYYQDETAESRAYGEQALRICREIGDRWGEDSTVWVVALVSRSEGEYDEARALFERRLRTMRETGNRRQEGLSLNSLGTICHRLGDYNGARVHYEQALRIYRETGWLRGEVGTLINLGMLCHQQGDDRAARQYCEQALLVQQRIAGPGSASALTVLGHALVGLGQLDGAADAYQQALALRRAVGLRYMAMDALAGLAGVWLTRRDLARAHAHVEEILSYLVGRTDRTLSSLFGLGEPLRVYLTCYRVLQASGDPRVDDILEEGYRFLQERAAKIGDEEERRSYLENVAANREIVREYARSQHEQ